MGKIHKALEKSKKEQQQSQKNPFGSLKTQLKDRRRSKVIVGKDREKRNLKTTADSKLAAIHALLDDTAKTKTTTPDARSLREPVQAHDDIRSDNRDQIPEVIDKIKPEREVDPVVSKKKRYEPPRPKPSIVNLSDGSGMVGSIGAVEVAGSDPNVIYVGTGSAGIRGNVSTGRGVWRSTDRGRVVDLPRPGEGRPHRRGSRWIPGMPTWPSSRPWATPSARTRSGASTAPGTAATPGSRSSSWRTRWGRWTWS